MVAETPVAIRLVFIAAGLTGSGSGSGSGTDGEAAIPTLV